MDYFGYLKSLRDGVENAINLTKFPNKEGISIDALSHLHNALSHLRACVFEIETSKK